MGRPEEPNGHEAPRVLVGDAELSALSDALVDRGRTGSLLRDLTSPEGTRSPPMRSCVYRLAVSEVRLALPNFYDVTVRIANVAARLAVLVLWLCDKLGSSTSP